MYYKYTVLATRIIHGFIKIPARLTLIFKNEYDMRNYLIKKFPCFDIYNYLKMFNTGRYYYPILVGESMNEIMWEALENFHGNAIIINGVVFDEVVNKVKKEPFNSENNLCKEKLRKDHCEHAIAGRMNRPINTLVPIYSNGKQKYVCFKCGKIMDSEV